MKKIIGYYGDKKGFYVIYQYKNGRTKMVLESNK